MVAVPSRIHTATVPVTVLPITFKYPGVTPASTVAAAA